MAGEDDLGKLLATMRPELQPGTFVFAILDDHDIPAGLDPIGTFREAEGTTLILPAHDAGHPAIVASKPMRQITLTVHSSLEAIGLTAAFATELTRHGISANVVAGYYHDHIFVGAEDAERAVVALQSLSESYR
ncbi:MAG: ACT domain-containing protein [Rhizobium sp.]|nr:ACT domain-containing protein [Rhizobium sp.]